MTSEYLEELAQEIKELPVQADEIKIARHYKKKMDLTPFSGVQGIFRDRDEKEYPCKVLDAHFDEITIGELGSANLGYGHRLSMNVLVDFATKKKDILVQSNCDQIQRGSAGSTGVRIITDDCSEEDRKPKEKIKKVKKSKVTAPTSEKEELDNIMKGK